MVSVLAFYFDDTSSTPADTYSFFYLKRCLKNLNKQKEARLAQFCKKKVYNIDTFDAKRYLKERK